MNRIPLFLPISLNTGSFLDKIESAMLFSLQQPNPQYCHTHGNQWIQQIQ